MDRLLTRRLGDAAVVFDLLNWQTHVLPPAACVVLEFIEECGGPGHALEAEVNRAISSSLGLDPESEEIARIRQTLREIGMFREQ
ncbi:MAG: HPr-rel-A system PqqD family peptide chaperone [Zoogloeaceae bacterium]|nr:HPr-rel-A system PqqD family peptide chaperone [Zoogloeaceae bacterium]MCP5255944.1 HPr-rel-A system PqqD family peptide chaperone [Zoogloeaceae bacterium]MCP5294068.1 HPr-rel-A system PqqD family peptide chaperone [Zoogloeaceae bacterium]